MPFIQQKPCTYQISIIAISTLRSSMCTRYLNRPYQFPVLESIVKQRTIKIEYLSNTLLPCVANTIHNSFPHERPALPKNYLQLHFSNFTAYNPKMIPHKVSSNTVSYHDIYERYGTLENKLGYH